MSENIRRCLITAAASWGATVLALFLGLENPYWATMTAWAATLPGRKIGPARAALQVLATIAGCLVGFQVALHAESRPVLQLLALGLIAAGGTYLKLRSRFNFAWALASLSALMILAFSLYNPGLLLPSALFRGYEIVCGVAAAMLTQALAGLAMELEPDEWAAPATLSDHATARQVALVAGLTVVVVPILWFEFHLPMMSLMVAMIAPLIVLDPGVAAHPTHLHWRHIGTLLGGLGGYVGTVLAGESFFVWSLAFVAGIAAFAYVNGSGRPWASAGPLGGIAFMFSIVAGTGPATTNALMIDRICGIVAGLFIMMAVAHVVRLAVRARDSERRAAEFHLSPGPDASIIRDAN